MTISDWLVILAIIIAPILAVQVQKIIESRRSKRERKLQVFKALMATRATPLSPIHVEALNMIDIEFYDDKMLGNYPLRGTSCILDGNESRYRRSLWDFTITENILQTKKPVRSFFGKFDGQMALDVLVVMKGISGNLELVTTLNISVLNASTSLQRHLELYLRRPEHLYLNGFWQ